MQFDYVLGLEEMQEWIAWTLGREDETKLRKGIFLIYGTLVLFLLAATVKTGGISDLPVSLVLAAAAGFFVFHATDKKQRFRYLLKKTGIERMARNNSFPTIHGDLGEEKLTLTSETQNFHQETRYQDILAILETEKLFLIQYEKSRYLLLAKSAFSGKEEEEAFKAFLGKKTGLEVVRA